MGAALLIVHYSELFHKALPPGYFKEEITTVTVDDIEPWNSDAILGGAYKEKLASAIYLNSTRGTLVSYMESRLIISIIYKNIRASYNTSCKKLLPRRTYTSLLPNA